MEIEQQDQLVEKITEGAVVVFPTDTTVGIGCSVEREESIERVFQLKGRSRSKSVPVLGIAEQLKGMIKVNDPIHRAIKEFWPGKLTIVREAKDPGRWSTLVIREGTMAVREPGFEPLRELLEQTGPLVGTSANLSGRPAPARVEDVHPELLQTVDAVVGGEAGEGESSTVVRWVGGEWKLHREGPVSKESLEQVTGETG